MMEKHLKDVPLGELLMVSPGVIMQVMSAEVYRKAWGEELPSGMVALSRPVAGDHSQWTLLKEDEPMGCEETTELFKSISVN